MTKTFSLWSSGILVFNSFRLVELAKKTEDLGFSVFISLIIMSVKDQLWKLRIIP